MNIQSIPCVQIADLFAGIEFLIPKFEKVLFYEPFWLGDAKFIAIDVVLSEAEDYSNDASWQIVYDRAQQLTGHLVRMN